MPPDTEKQAASLTDDQKTGRHEELEVVPIEQGVSQEPYRVHLSWRSWLVVFITCFAVMAQVFVVVAAGSVIAFIIRDLGDASIAGWVIQGPLLMQSVLSPIVGRLSDVLDRKFLATVPPLAAFVGAVVSAKATSMSMLIGGGILIGTTLATISVVQAIPSEILPLKFRALANGFAFVGGAVGGLIGSLGAGAPPFTVLQQSGSFASTGLRDTSNTLERRYETAYGPVIQLDPYYLSAAQRLCCSDLIGPEERTLEWRGRSDGLVAHVFFRKNANFVYSVFAFAVEGWIFYSAVNSVVPQIALNLGFESNAWRISVRQLSYQLPVLFASVPITWYATRFKDMQAPLLVTFTIFLIVTICYSTIQPSWSLAQLGFNVLAGIGQAGPLTLLVACIQFTAPHAFLSTATGLAFSARAIGGAFGSAVLNAIINGRLASHYAASIEKAALGAGLAIESMPALLEALATGQIGSGVDTATPTVWNAAVEVSRWEYAHAYRLAWASVIPFVVLAIVAVALLKGVKDLMTEEVEATVERVES
ncbi:hypothetical protein Daesc_006038 [Daldinia eschscholtzii]|uniref:Major facilitator superfamily (MFS) profile domain-containing protein n=1 Tax=Daldinia eschscholtzii TaxID=292717 RepID=A0AAX6MGG5_9PEZI